MDSELWAKLGALNPWTTEGLQDFNTILFGGPLHPGQVKWRLNATKQTNLLSPGNSWGKTEFIKRDAVLWNWYKLCPDNPWLHASWESWWNLDYRTLVASFQFDIAKETFQRLRHSIDGGEPLSGLVARIIESDPPKIEFHNRSVLDFGSLDHGGRHVEATRRRKIWVDEAGHQRDLKKIYDDVLYPRTMGVGGIIDLYGTPKEQTDPWLYEVFMFGQDNHPFFYSQEGSSLENVFWPEGEKERVLSNPNLVYPDGTLTPKGEQVIKGRFLNTGGRFFDPVDVLRMFSGDHGWYVPKGSCLQAYDVAGSKRKADARVGITLDTSAFPYRVCRLDYWPGGTQNWQQFYDHVEASYKETGAWLVGLDVTGPTGDSIQEELENRGISVEPFNFGGASQKKYNMLRNLQSMMQTERDVKEKDGGTKRVKGLVRFPDFHKYQELEPRKHEFDQYTLDDKKLRQDTVMALAMVAQLAGDNTDVQFFSGMSW